MRQQKIARQIQRDMADIFSKEAASFLQGAMVTVTAVRVSPDRIRYTEGDGFDPTGLVITATYSDGCTEPVTDYRLSAPEKLTVADTTVTVFYGALRTSFAIEVTERTPWGGSGTAEDPYRIGTAEELAALGEKVAKGNPYTDVTFVLTANIDLSDYPDWKPIGKDSAQFDGIFDGRGYAIDNLYSKKGGLFGTVCTNAVIRNVGVASGQIGSENLSFMGAIAKWSNGADFINCWNGADILCSGWSGGRQPRLPKAAAIRGERFPPARRWPIPTSRSRGRILNATRRDAR